MCLRLFGCVSDFLLAFASLVLNQVFSKSIGSIPPKLRSVDPFAIKNQIFGYLKKQVCGDGRIGLYVAFKAHRNVVTIELGDLLSFAKQQCAVPRRLAVGAISLKDSMQTKLRSKQCNRRAKKHIKTVETYQNKHRTG